MFRNVPAAVFVFGGQSPLYVFRGHATTPAGRGLGIPVP